MAGFLELIDNTLGTHFNAPVYKPETGRSKMVKLIDTAAEQHGSGKTPPTRSWKTGSNKAVSFSPRLNGNPVLIGGHETNYIPAERFQDFLKQLKTGVEAGDLDDAIKDALDGKSKASSAAPRASRASSGGTRNTGTQSKLNIGVAGKRRGKSPASFEDIRAHYIAEGHDAAMIDAAIEKRKAAEAK